MPGIDNYRDAESMQAYLDPILEKAHEFVTNELNVGAGRVPIYLFATSGMRVGVPDAETQGIILDEAWLRMSANIFPRFNAGLARETNARVIDGKMEGLFAWVANNYGRGDHIRDIFEVGGSSAQFAFYKNSADLSTEKVCLHSNSDGYNVFSESWDGLGVNAAFRLVSRDFYRTRIGALNPCLPTFRADDMEGMKGIGDILQCMLLSSQGLAKYTSGLPLSPSFPNMGREFIGISVPMYTYKFFSEQPNSGFEFDEPYNAARFKQAFMDYCNADEAALPDNRSPSIIAMTCFSAAWTWTMLHDPKGLGLSNDTLIFPANDDLELRSTWTIGVAALYARHHDVILCPDRESIVHNDNGGTLGLSTTPSVQPTYNDFATLYASADHAGIKSTLKSSITSMPPPAIRDLAAFSIVLISIMIIFFAYRHRRISTFAKIALPVEMSPSLV